MQLGNLPPIKTMGQTESVSGDELNFKALENRLNERMDSMQKQHMFIWIALAIVLFIALRNGKN
jgi:hypothetical protein